MALKPSNRKKAAPVIMAQVNGKTGKTEKIMRGGERIYSQVHTKSIISKVLDLDTRNDYINLGKFMAEVIQKQDTQKPQFTEE